MNTAEAATVALAIAEDIKPLLAGSSPDIQGAILAELIGLYLAGHPRQYRPDAMRMITVTAFQLAEQSEQMMFGDKGHPGNSVN